MRKIAFIGHDAGRTGAPMVLLHLLRWLRAQGEVDFDTHIVRTGALIDDYLKVSTVIVNGSRVDSAADVQKGRLARLVDKAQKRLAPRIQYDLIYSNTITNGAVLAELVGSKRTRVITHVHEMDYWVEQAGAANWKTICDHTDIFIAASGAVSDMLQRRGISKNAIRVIEEFIETAAVQRASYDGRKVRAKYGIPDDAFVVAGGGAETWRKGKDLFVQLAGQLNTRKPSRPIYFMWVGSKLDREAGYWAAHDAKLLGLDGRMIWTGPVNDPLHHFAASDAFALLSREDPFPLVCLEAALLGKPIICFKGSGGIPDLVEQDAGAIVPYLDIGAMADHLLNWCNGADVIARLGERASQKVRTLYSVDVQAPKILEVIHEQLAQTEHHGH